MSLINDALKRAKQAQPANLAPADGPALRPVERAPRSERPDFLMPALIVVILALAGLLVWQWSLGAGTTTVRARTVAATETIQTAPVSQAQIVAAPATIAAPQPVTNAVVAAEPPKPAPIVYKLQSVFYFPQNPSAVINGKTVHQGSLLAGDAHVVTIGQESATIVTASGETNLLELP